jgi:hypothetical protein
MLDGKRPRTHDAHRAGGKHWRQQHVPFREGTLWRRASSHLDVVVLAIGLIAIVLMIVLL